MNSLNCNIRWTLMALLWVVIGTSLASAETNDRIVFGKDFEVTESRGDGYQGTWYYYPHSDEYIMWFRNTNNCAPDYPLQIKLRVATLITHFVDKPLDEFTEEDIDSWYNLNIHHGWTTPAWSNENQSTPPLPHLMSSSSAESQYLTSNAFITMDPNEQRYHWIRVQETRASPRVQGHNPQWIYVAARGRNVGVFSHFDFYCDDGTVVDPEVAPYGACCNRQSGACYISQQANCPSPHEWLGADTDCDDCKELGPIWDYGDAPSSYPVLLVDGGPTHIIGPDVFLGEEVTVESDGKPNATATGDSDDGVILPAKLIAGTPAVVRLTASTYGVVNAWLDNNRDGDWDDSGEQVFVDEPVQPGQNILSMPVLAAASPGVSYARFRFSTGGALGPRGQARDGEVEDYQVQIGPSETPPVPSPGPNPIGVNASPARQYYPKWRQAANDNPPPGITGWPETSMHTDGPIMLDDWQSAGGEPVIGIRWWGSFADWSDMRLPETAPASFHVGIWTDDFYSNVPGSLIWSKVSTDWSWVYAGALQDPKGPASGDACFEFVQTLSQDEWFQPTLEAGTRYWISIAAMYDTHNPDYAWGWVTRQSSYAEPAIIMGEIMSLSLQTIRLGLPNLGDTFHRGMAVMYPSNELWDLSFDLLSSRTAAGPGKPPAMVDEQVSGNDLNGDGVVDIQDISMLMRLWLDD